MKSLILCLIFNLFFCFNALTQTDSTGRWHCGTVTDTNESPYSGPILNQNMKVVVVFIDFPDGRLSNGQVPTEDWQLDPAYIQNLDAVFNMGYLSNDGNNFSRKTRKLTYEQLWNIYFSEDVYVTDEAHPDWMSHGRWNLPPTGDHAKAYGSLKDYYKEVSNDHLILQPGETRSGIPGIYTTGIVNNIVEDSWGNKYAVPIMLDHPKLSHYGVPNNDPSNEATGLDNIKTAAATKVQQLYNQNQIDFNLSAFDGKVIYVMPGGTYWIGGVAGGSNCIIREKLIPNSFLQQTDPLLKYAVINGVGIVCHEFGHLLGWGHTVNGNYDIMNGNGKDMQNCPSHPNVFYKLNAGWIDENRIRKIRTTSELTGLPPTELNGDIAVLTIYGKPGFDNKWTHSEYYVFENRRMFPRGDLSVKFDKKLVWRGGIGTPTNFNGGLLVNHWVKYNSGQFEDNGFKIINASPLRDWNLIYDDGDSRDFFGVTTSDPQTPVFTQLPPSRTNSSFNLPTGLNITNISGGSAPNYYLSFNTNYSLGEPPDYNFLYYGQTLPAIVNLSGNVFMHSSNIGNREVTIEPGTILDFPNQRLIVSPNANLIAPGTSHNGIIFRGCGYGQNRLAFSGLLIGNRPLNSPTSSPTIISYCNFDNLNIQKALQVVTNSATNIPLIIEGNSSSRTDAFIEFSPHQADLNVLRIAYNEMDVHFKPTTGKIKIIVGLHSPPNKTLYFYPHTSGAYYLFGDNSALNIEGKIIAIGNSQTDKIIFDRITPSPYDHYSFTVWGELQLKYCDIKNSIGLIITQPSGSVNIENCLFENNHFWDISLYGFYSSSESSRLIKNNVFNTGSYQYASILCANGDNVLVQGNTFNNVSNHGIHLSYVSNPQITENIIYASTNISYYPLAGIFSYSSAGNINCNYPTNFYKGILLDNSSPKLFNNTITNNSIGLFLTNGSSPQMAPSFENDITLYDGGYNHIFNNLYEEIKCNNISGDSKIPLSFPILDNGSNAIFHEGQSDCLIDIGIQPSFQYSITNNYWGSNGPAGRICPGEVNVNYTPYLTEEPQYLMCYPSEQISDNSFMSQEALLLGSANIDYYHDNYSSASSKYKQLITLCNNSQKSYLPVSRIYHCAVMDMEGDFGLLQNYYSSLANQFYSDTSFRSLVSSYSTSSVVMQPEYQEAIEEYQSVINTSQNQIERHYAIIDQLRAACMMFDSNMSGNGGDNIGNQMVLDNYSLNSLIKNSISQDLFYNSRVKSNNARKDQAILDISMVTPNKISAYLETIKKHLYINNPDIENMTLAEKSKLLERIIAYKLYEYSLMNISASRPLNKVMPNYHNMDNYSNLPFVYKLHQNYPNPFNPVSTIKFDIPKESKVVIKIYDLIGREVMTLVNELKQPGFYETVFDGRNLASGLYIYRIEAGSFVDVKKMVLVK